MDTAAAASPSPATTQNPSTQSAELIGKDTRDWVRPKPPASSEPPKQEARERAAPVATPKEAKAESKEKPTSEKPHTEKPKAKPAEPDDPEIEVEGEDGQLVKVKLSELKEARRRNKEIERVSQERFRSAADQRKEVDAIRAQYNEAIAALQQDPWAFNRAHLMRSEGLTQEQAEAKLNDLAEQRLVQQMQRAQMTPEQIQAEKDRTELEALRAKDQKRDEEQKAARFNELKAKHREQWDRTIAEAMTVGKLPKVRDSAARVAKALADHMDPETGKSIDPTTAARIVRSELQTVVRSTLSELLASNPQEAMDLVGEDFVKACIALKAKAHQEFEPQRPKSPPSQPTPPKKTQPPTLEEARAKLGIRRY